jgi:hypothetical protein
MVHFLKLKYLKSFIVTISIYYVKLILRFEIKFLPIVIKIEGGLGGQLLNLWLLEYLESTGYFVMGDYSYFTSYNGQDDVSSWKWQATPFGYKLLKNQKYTLIKKILSLRDCELKFAHILKAACRRTESYKKIDQELLNSFEQLQLKNYLVIHQRKGDYLNVASYIINDKVIMDQVSSLCTECRTCVYLSDGPISERLKLFLSKRFQYLRFFDDNQLLPELSHLTLSKADTAIISNSQFSLSSGIFAKRTVFPPKWNGKKAWDEIFTSYISVHNENKNF